jgi:NDP-sugar pyrophosphorylase family protein
MSEILPVAILAGGLATRLRPTTDTLPKALIDINGQPFIAHQLRLLRRSGIERVILCVGYRGEQIAAEVGDGERFGLHVTLSFDGPALLGTAGAIKRALPTLGRSFFVLYGDSYLECDYRKTQDAFERSERLGLMTVYRNEGQWDTSNIEYRNGTIISYDKKHRTPQMRHIDYGLGVFQGEAFDRIPEGTACDLETVYHDLNRRDQLAALEVTQRFYEIGSWRGVEELRNHLAAQ